MGGVIKKIGLVQKFCTGSSKSKPQVKNWTTTCTLYECLYKIIILHDFFKFLLCRRGTLQGSAASANSPHDTSQENDDASLEVTPLMVVIFVILICGTLLLLFYFYNYLVYVVIVLFCLAACNGFYECMRPIVLWLPLGMYIFILITKLLLWSHVHCIFIVMGLLHH